VVFRIIARLDVKPPFLVKGIHLEGFRKLGTPQEFAIEYYQQGIDEINYQDIIASLFGFDSTIELVASTASQVFLPITVGGGIRTLEGARSLIFKGADKVCINTSAVQNPNLIKEISQEFGSQAVVIGIEAKRSGDHWIAMSNNGREHTGFDVVELVNTISEYGAGEIMLTSIDFEGTQKGFDLELISKVRNETILPLIAHGGFGSLEDALMAYQAGADGISIASALHWKKFKVSDIKNYLSKNKVEVRTS